MHIIPRDSSTLINHACGHEMLRKNRNVNAVMILPVCSDLHVLSAENSYSLCRELLHLGAAWLKAQSEQLLTHINVLFH